MLGAIEVECGGVEVRAEELGSAEDCAGEVLEVEVLGAGELWLGELWLGELWLGDGQVAVGKNWPRAEPSA